LVDKGNSRGQSNTSSIIVMLYRKKSRCFFNKIKSYL
jgi:hypothetical protein